MTEREATRREMMKLALLGGGYLLLQPDGGVARASSKFADSPRSPATRPWIAELPGRPEEPQAVAPFSDFTPEIEREFRRNCPTCPAVVGSNTQFFEIAAQERMVRFHPDLNQTPVWSYVDLSPNALPPSILGPSLRERLGVFKLGDPGGFGTMVRYRNQLPTDPRTFGIPRTTIHLHGGHQPSRTDGFPENLAGFPNFVTEVGEVFDYYYPVLDVGALEGSIDTGERPSTQWYHDHILAFTGPNVYRGLAGIILISDELDSLDEEDPNPTALRLPGGDFDIPIVLQDKLFAPDGSLVYNVFEADGFLGDKVAVNGAIQPFKNIDRRKYRFRFLNGSNARIYGIYLTNASGQKFPMTQVASEGGLLSRPSQPIDSFTIAMAERVEVVIDFGDPIFHGQRELFFENRLLQTNGRKPDKLVSRGDQLVKLFLGGFVPDPSRVGIPNPTTGDLELRPFDRISPQELQRAKHRTFVFERKHGAWAINGELAGQLESPMASPIRNEPEIWHLVNKSGGWWHPIHIHSELQRVLSRNGKQPPFAEQDGIGRKDTTLLRADGTADVFLKFRDYTGPFVFHCHNIEHEDMEMMARFDVIER